jgi:hypothetical protein
MFLALVRHITPDNWQITLGVRRLTAHPGAAGSWPESRCEEPGPPAQRDRRHIGFDDCVA